MATTDYRVIDIPFAFGSGGYVSTVKDNSRKAWRNKIITILSTERGSRIWYDRFGASINTLVFDNVDTATTLLKDAISEAFVRWIPEVKLAQVLYNYDSNNAVLTITVYYTLPTGEEDAVTINQSTITSSGDTTQVGYVNG